ncbi:hypothetical protein Tco_0857088 [Tanacetum coccineum]|uniref:Retrotransposon gag domain-containing protein n=1 Tax=Tanacetum coccineum TaxID=301880 RepID=A0ABQ5B5Z0_9ASTR
MMFLALNKKEKRGKVTKVIKTMGKQFEEIKERERFLGIDTRKPLHFQYPFKTSPKLKKRKRAMEHEPEPSIAPFQRVSEMHMVDTQTHFCYKISSLAEKSPEALSMTSEREDTPPPGFSTLTPLPGANVGELPPITAFPFTTRSPENTPLAYRASTSANPDHEYDKEREMELGQARVRETTPVLQTGSPRVRRRRERVVESEEAPNRDGSRVEREPKGMRPSKRRVEEGGSRGGNLPSILAAHLGRSSIVNYKDLKAKFRSHFSQQKKFTKTYLAVHNIKQRDEESTRAFITQYIDDTLQILCFHEEQRISGQIIGFHEEQRLSGFVHGLKTRSLVEFLSTDLPTTYKGLMEKTYTWIEAKEVATNGVPSDHK